MTRTIRFRITALAVVVFGFVAGAGAVGLVIVQRATLADSLDDTLEQRTDEVLARLDRPDASLIGGGDDVVAQLVGDRGQVLDASPLLAGRPAVLPPTDSVRTGSVDLDGFDRARFRSTAALPGTTLHVIGSLDDVDEAVTALSTSLAVGVPAAVAVLGCTVWWLVGRTLRPVDAIRAEVEEIGDDRWGGWHRRVPEPGSGDEIDRLAATMNTMLTQLGQTVERQRRFVDDAAHELRSPLTRLRTGLEVAADDPDRDPAHELRAALDDVVDLAALVEDLLVLARLDAGRDVAGRVAPDRDVDLDVLAAEVARDQRAVTPGVGVDTRAITAARCTGDDRLLRRAIENLLANGARHATTTVRITTHEDDADAVVTVDDDGPGIADRDREAVFERFTRLDKARTRDDGGVGLGLSITRAVAIRHGGSVTVRDSALGGARFELRLPRSRDGSATADSTIDDAI